MNLNTEQITHISQSLTQNGIKDIELHAELLDHICCEVESDMDAGSNFISAYKQTMETYQPKTMKRVQAQSQKARRGSSALMLKATILSSLLLISMFLSWGYFQEEKQMPVVEAVKAIVAFEPQQNSLIFFLLF